ncbi:MAG TPA: SRPBCC family protein [Candidatus Sulfopaludibacter sp.]|jgi:hypothetical protein|nr:SRPBCC family protein [Candidatus Sulfopaludibacter sp.]
MKWVLLAIAALVVIVGLAAAVGSMLPVKHRATRKARFRASAEALYAVIAGPPEWRTGVKSFGILPEKDGRRQWWEEDSHGQKITYELIEESPARRLATRIVGPNLPFGGTWTFEIAPAPGGGADLRITEDGEIYNVMFRFMARFFFGYNASIEGYLRDLATKFSDTAVIEA